MPGFGHRWNERERNGFVLCYRITRMNDHEQDGEYVCEACGKHFETEEDLNRHVRRVGVAE